MKNFILGLVCFSFIACNNNSIKAPETEVENFSYSFGIVHATSLKSQGMDTILDVNLMAQALKDVFLGNETHISVEEADSIFNEYFKNLQEINNKKNIKLSQKNMELGNEFLAENAEKEGVIVTGSGLQYQVIHESSGDSPSESDVVTIHYHGTLIDGTVFDSSLDRGEPATFPVNGVIPGFSEGLQLMSVGGKSKFVIPSALAYGENGTGGIGPNATLIFEVELISIN